jgi:dienelactone hydrolase
MLRLGYACMAAILLLRSVVSGAQPQDNVSLGENESKLKIERSVPLSGFDGETCWVHARAGSIPADAVANRPAASIMTMQKLLLSGSDVFSGLYAMRSRDGGQNWSSPRPCRGFERQVYGQGDAWSQSAAATNAAKALVAPGDEVTVCDFVPQWHAASQRLLGIGQTVWYRQNRVMSLRPRSVAYAVYNPAAKDDTGTQWSAWQTLKLPDEARFLNAGAGSGQRVDLPGGDILLPIYYKEPTAKQYSVTVCRCRFDGHRLEFIEHGSELTVPIARGLYEPSLAFWNGRYFLTLRNDESGYVSVSHDGLQFDEPVKWQWTDGTELGNYNTQQHWVTHASGLYLVYTRRGANNDNVFRHRAPLFMARVNAESLQVERETEVELIANRGARLGNFGVTPVDQNETWITAAEWMQPAGVERFGSDNSLHIVKLQSEPSTTTSRDEVSPDRTPAQLIAPYFMPPVRYRDEYGDYPSPLVRPSDGGRITTPEAWLERREELRSEWEALLGKWPPLIEQPAVEFLASTPRDGYMQHRVRFEWIPGQQTEGWLLIPAGDGPHPAVLSVFYEPDTAIGDGSPNRDFALQLVQRGFVCLSIGTTEATQAKTYGLYYPSLQAAQVQPLSMLACAAANAWYVLASQPQVDAERIGVVGHSFGGKWAMFAACLFDKFACGAWSDPGIVFDESRPNVNYWEPWYLGYHPPPWRERGIITADNPARGLYVELRTAERDLHELHALMAPRPFLVSGGSEDGLERWPALNHSIAVNRLLGYKDRVAMTNRPDHGPNDDSNRLLCAFFEHFLVGAEGR